MMMKHDQSECPETICFKTILSCFKEIDYLKIDIEGGEYELFDQSEDLECLMRGVRFLDLEIHKLEDYEPNYETIIAYSHNDKAMDELLEYVKHLGFRDDPHPEVLIKHGKYAIGSKNQNFEGV